MERRLLAQIAARCSTRKWGGCVWRDILAAGGLDALRHKRDREAPLMV
jgi:hypothetical protein